ncbi:hypothetical protein [Nitratifractor sp.]
MKKSLAIVAAAMLLATPEVQAQSPQKPAEAIHFAKGGSSARIEGSIKGFESRRYTLRASKGQTMNASAGSKNGALQLVIFAPAQKPGLDMPLFSSERNGGIYEGILPATGDYLFEVSLLRSAARKEEKAEFVLEVSVSGKPEAGAKPVQTDKLDWPSQFDAKGSIACSKGEPDFRHRCDFRVKRNPYGATLWLLAPGSDKKVRVLYYEKRKFSTGDTLVPVEQQRQGDNWWVGIGQKEFYLIPDAILQGG